jgi:LacI family transcriptional regulator
VEPVLEELTIEDIAKKVGVSRSTVSRVLNGFPNVSLDVRKRVLKEIQVTGFQPNAAARSLASKRTGMIGLVLPQSVSSFFTDPFFPLLTQGIALACNNHDLSLSLFLVGNKEDEKKIFPRISRQGMLDGILIQSGQPGEALIDHLNKSSVPSAMIGRPFESDGISYIDIDNVSSARNATHHLINLGYQRIATITGPKNSTVTIDRLEGYTKALIRSNRKVDENLVAEGVYSEASGYTAMKNLLPFKPDAVFIASDIAIGAIRAAQEAGLRIPDDIAFVGIDDIPLGMLTNLQLTIIRQPILRLGIKAVDLLIDLIENGNKPARRLILETELVIRDSCGARKFEGMLTCG